LQIRAISSINIGIVEIRRKEIVLLNTKDKYTKVSRNAIQAFLRPKEKGKYT
jgi:hypothetical protein